MGRASFVDAHTMRIAPKGVYNYYEHQAIDFAPNHAQLFFLVSDLHTDNGEPYNITSDRFLLCTGASPRIPTWLHDKKVKVASCVIWPPSRSSN